MSVPATSFLLALALFLPRPALALAVTDASCTVQADNALRFDCRIETDAAARVHVRFCDATADGPLCARTRQSESAQTTASTTCSSGDSCFSAQVRVYNTIAGHSYPWEAMASSPAGRASFRPTGAASFMRPGPLPSPDLAGLDLFVTAPDPSASALSYVAFNYACSTFGGVPPVTEAIDTFIIADVDGNIVWYQDPREQTGRADSQIVAFHVTQPDGTILLIDGFQTVLEYALTGDVVAMLDMDSDDFVGTDGISRFPHHDLQRIGDSTWVVVAGAHDYVDINDCDGDGRTTDVNRYTLDGVYVFDEDWVLDDAPPWTLADIYRPQDCGGPQPPDCLPAIGSPDIDACDWFHTNSMHVVGTGKWLLSSRNQHKLIQVDAASGALDWELHGDNAVTGGGDWDADVDASITTPQFSGQHDARIVARDRILLFDNHSEDDDALPRGLALALDARRRTFRVTQAWDMSVPDDDCTTAGSIYPVGDDHVLVACGSGATIREYDGAGEQVWEMSLSCTEGLDIGQVYRARPISLP